jgi:hypothetical protein
MTDALTWAGTFHSIGARLLREYAAEIGLDPTFSIHDREDSADLMNPVRHEFGFSTTQNRFPTKATCLAIYSRCVNAETALEKVVRASYPWCAGWAAELRQLFATYVEAKQRQNVLDYDDLLLYWAQMVAEPSIAELGGRLTMSLSTNTRTPIVFNPRSCSPSSQAAKASQWLGTMPSQSIPSGQRRSRPSNSTPDRSRISASNAPDPALPSTGERRWRSRRSTIRLGSMRTTANALHAASSLSDSIFCNFPFSLSRSEIF